MTSSSYLVMLTGAGPTRAFVERVTHVAYLASMTGDVVQVLPFPDMATRLKKHGLHHTVLKREGHEYVSIFIPFLPRNYVSPSTTCAVGYLYALDARNDVEARDRFVEWCRSYAT